MSGGVLIWAQHLLGIGHLRRAATLTRAMAGHGLDVTLVSGGMPGALSPSDGVDFVQLAPLQAADARFSGLVDENGHAPDEAFWAARRAHLLEIFRSAAPRVLITELFPFGRRAFSTELIALLEAAHAASPKPAVLASVRDVLTLKCKCERYTEMAERTLRWYRRVLIHGDPNFLPFKASFPQTERIAHMLRYTGYVAEERPLPPNCSDGSEEVIVSAGGGAVGIRLLQAAIAARPHTALVGHTWRLLTGDNLPAAELARLRDDAPPGVVVEQARPDFPALLAGAAVSVSQAGYNTVMDLVRARTRTVLVPFVGDGETEQTMRAERLAACGSARVVPEAALEPTILARAINAAWSAPRPADIAIDLSGAETTARMVAELAGR